MGVHASKIIINDIFTSHNMSNNKFLILRIVSQSKMTSLKFNIAFYSVFIQAIFQNQISIQYTHLYKRMDWAHQLLRIFRPSLFVCTFINLFIIGIVDRISLIKNSTCVYFNQTNICRPTVMYLHRRLICMILTKFSFSLTVDFSFNQNELE